MKKVFYTFALVACALSMQTVYGAGVKVPASTTVIEKAKAVIAAPANTNGANVDLTLLRCYDGYAVYGLQISEIHWASDETFYLNGYKALLNKEVKEIFVPPSRRNIGNSGYNS